MTQRWKVFLIAGLAMAVLAAAIYFPFLRRRVMRAAKLQQQSQEQARRELIQPAAVNPADPRVKTSLFWASDAGDSTLAPVTVELPLSRDAVPLGFYLLPDGTAIADFSEALATSIPSGIVSEQLAVDSITRTLEANVPQVQRLKILIHGQEAETLAGHLDLTGAFAVRSRQAQLPANQPLTAPGSEKPVAPTSDKPPASATGKLTPDKGPGKLAQPERKS